MSKVMRMKEQTLNSSDVSKQFTCSVYDSVFMLPKCCSRSTQCICEPKSKLRLIKKPRILLNSRRKSILDLSNFCLSASDLISTGLHLCQEVVNRSRPVQRRPLAKQPQGVSSAEPSNYLRDNPLSSNHRVAGVYQGCSEADGNNGCPLP